MKEFEKYFIMLFSALLPLVNPPGSAFELLGIVGMVESRSFRVLARKISINTAFFLCAVTVVGPFALQFFGISVEALQVGGGAVLAAMGWSLLNKPEAKEQIGDAGIRKAAEECVADCWQAKMFYPLTFPVTVGPGSIAVMLTISAQANSLPIRDRIGAFVGLLFCIALLSLMVYICYAYAPAVAGFAPPALAHGVLRIIAFLLICIGVQIAWNGIRAMVAGWVH
jgi:multiple antibiotic resistance protein